jgi:HEAT repeat protein
VLEKMGSKAETAVSALLETQVDPDPLLRLTGFNALEKVTTPASLDALVRGTKDKRPEVRAVACRLLRKYAEAGSAGVDALLRCLSKDKDPEVRRFAASSLGSYRTHYQSVVPALVRAAEDKAVILKGVEDWGSVGETAILSLGRFGARARAAIPALVKLAKSPEARTRRAVMSAFESMRLVAPVIENAVKEGTKDEDPVVRWQAEKTLERLKTISR